jgi:hypothetical protein
MAQQEPWTYERLITTPKSDLINEVNSKLGGAMGINPNQAQAAIHARDAIQAQLFLSELARRDQEEQTEKMVKSTQTMLCYTWVIVILTVVITAATIAQLVIASVRR